MAKTVLLHIGLPKTGTTSIQRLLQANVPKLQAQGFDVYRANLLGRKNAVELQISSIRDDVTTLSKIVFPDVDQNELHARTRAAISDFLAQTKADRIIFSCEDLHLLRTSEECARLRKLFPEDVRFEVFMVLREPQEWLKSYTEQIVKIKMPGREISDDPTSALYVKPDTWVLDFKALARCYSDNVGPVTSLDYDRSSANSNLLKAFGAIPWEGVDDFRVNVSRWNLSPLQRLRRRVALRTRLRRGLARFGLK